MGKYQDPGSGINIPDPQHCRQSVSVANTDQGSGAFFEDPGLKKSGYGNRDEHPVSFTRA
jgi:hypothetical protein